MSFTEMKFDRALIEGLVKSKQAALKANKGVSDLLGYALGVIARRLAKDPLRYRDYGPYYWALKAVLNTNGYSYGAESDSVVAAEYRGITELETVIMADQFRTEWLDSAQVGTANFRLSEDGDDYVLYDADVEAMPAGIIPRSGASANLVKQGNLVLDNADGGPVLTGFKHNAKGAIKALRELGDGVAIAALYHKDIGDIDLRWGEASSNDRATGHGLAKIIEWHPEVLDDLQKFVGALEIQQKQRTKIIMKGRGNKKAALRIDLESGSGHWLLTAYVKKGVFDSARSTADHTFAPGPILTTPSNEDKWIIGFEV